MVNDEQPQKILIIGAGLAGLVLAQILRKKGIPFAIFERDEAAQGRKQGWAVALVNCLPALEALLPPDMMSALFAVSINHGLGVYDELAFVHRITAAKIGTTGGIEYGKPGYFLRVGRENLRHFLWDWEDLPVSTRKRFTHYEEDDEGVTAFFADGTAARGSLLVGCDGVHSRVREQLIGVDSAPVLSKYVPISGECTLSPSAYGPLRALGNAAILVGAAGVRYQIGMLSMSPDHSSAQYFWVVASRFEDPQAESDWVARQATKQELFEKALDLTKDMADLLTGPIRQSGAAGIVMPQLKFLEFVPPLALPQGRVTLLGDAAHTMTPFRGAGANTAILDACELATLLARDRNVLFATDGGVPLEKQSKEDGKSFPQREAMSKLKTEYESTMLARGREQVLSSRAAGEIEGDPTDQWLELFRNR